MHYFCNFNESFWKKEDFVNSVKNKDVIFLVAEENKKLVGFVLGMINLVKRDEAYLQETRVNKKDTRKGIGTKLVDAFCKETKKRGVKEIFSEIEKEHVKFYIDSCKFKNRGKHILLIKKLK